MASTTTQRVARTTVVVSLLGLMALLAPALAVHRFPTARAATNLIVGGTAIVSDANGDPVRLRRRPGLGSEILTLVPEGAEVAVVGQLVEASDGSLWWKVAYGGFRGYMIADYLSLGGTSGGGGGDAVTTSDLNLRSGPSTGDSVLLVMPPGAGVTVTGGPVNGFYPVRYRGTDGWAYGDYLDFGGGGGAPLVKPSATGRARVIDGALNLRSGPSTADPVLLVMPDGGVVKLLGEESNGFLHVRYDGVNGWAYGAYLEIRDGGDSGSSSGSSWLSSAEAIGQAATTTALNLRAGPGTGNAVILVIPSGGNVEILGDPEQGFYPVRYAGETGWAHGDFLSFGSSGSSGSRSSSSSRIIWPVSGGEWMISQGYNGSSHYNGSSTSQYHYSLDIIRTDGNTAGQPVYSPVNGTIRWTERASGGISIDMGDGYAVAMFHMTVDPSLRWGDRVSQGQYLGFISGPGQDGNMGFDHLHFTVWATEDGGNWSRVAVPFSGRNAIAGLDLPDTGGYNQWRGTVFYP